jgi:hypothetical protein
MGKGEGTKTNEMRSFEFALVNLSFVCQKVVCQSGSRYFFQFLGYILGSVDDVLKCEKVLFSNFDI